MQLGKKSKTTDMFERVRGDLGVAPEESAPLISNAPVTAESVPSARASTSLDRDSIHVTVAETISAKLTREGSLKTFEVKGDLQLRISDPSLTKVKLDLVADTSTGVQFRTHPNVDKALFGSSKTIQLKDATKGFPANNSVGVLRWKAGAKADENEVLPISFTVWVNKGSEDSYTVTLEYESSATESLKDVSVSIPFSTSEPVVSSFDAAYEVSGDTLEWNIGTLDGDGQSGSFEFEAHAEDEGEFFPMRVSFSKTKPFVDVDVSSLPFMVFTVALELIFFIGIIGDTPRHERGCVLYKRDQVRCRVVCDRVKTKWLRDRVNIQPLSLGATPWDDRFGVEIT
jgi:hypothetical protein